jgi:hypothetical protein
LWDAFGGGFPFGELGAGEEDQAEVLAIGFVDVAANGEKHFLSPFLFFNRGLVCAWRG